jgi:hypothetical protein
MKKSKHQMLAAAAARILKPLIRILLRNGVSYGTFADIAKSQFVEVARKEFGIEGRKQSISRVAVITGLTRKEVQRHIRVRHPKDMESADRYHRAARVIGGWRRDEQFIDHRGKPAILAITGDGDTFQELVRRYSGDVPYRAVLDELVAEGAAERLDGDRVKLIDRAYLPRTDESMKLHILGADTAFLIDTIDHNLKGERETPRFQRKVLYDNLPDEALSEFQRLSSRAAQNLLEKLDRWLSDHDRDTQPDIKGSGRNLAGLGIYYFEKPHSGSEED